MDFIRKEAFKNTDYELLDTKEERLRDERDRKEAMRMHKET